MSDGVVWDPFQHEMLEALGLQPWVRATPVSGTSPNDVDLVAVVMASAGDAPVTADSMSLPNAITPRLFAALARAAGCAPQVLAALPDLQQALQGFRPDPAGKRALWPLLRRVRTRQA